MEEDEDPPDDCRHNQKFSKLITMVQDKEVTLIEPNSFSPGVQAYLNLSTHPEVYIDIERGFYGFPSTVRVIKKANNKSGEISETHLAFINPHDPTKIHYTKQVLLGVDNKYSKFGTEDTRITDVPRNKLPEKLKNEFTKDRIYALTSVAYDGINPRIVLDLTEDFEKIVHFGVIGPQIPYAKAIKNLPKEFGYRDYAEKQFREKVPKDKFLIDPGFILPSKDPALQYNDYYNEWEFWHRVEPHMQIARAKKLTDYLETTYWTNQIKNLAQSTILKAGEEKWNSEKIGLGGAPILIGDKYFAHYHGVEKKQKNSKTIYNYSGAFFIYDPINRKIESAQRSQYLIPSNKTQDILVEGNIEKNIIFPMGILPDPEDSETMWSYCGKGDKSIIARSTNIKWAKEDLAHEHNLRQVA